MIESKTSEPLVSIIIPVYNGANYLSESIECVLNQTYKNIELIVVNDGSTEKETDMIARSYTDVRMKYYVKENGGVASAVNFGVSQSSGEYICWLSHDDLMPFDKIKKQMDAIARMNFPSKVITYGRSDIIDEHGKKRLLKSLMFKVSKRGFKSTSDYFKIKDLVYSSLLIPRSFLVEHPLINELRYAQDYFSFFQMLESGYKLLYVKGAKTSYRVHRKQGSFVRIHEYTRDTQYRHLIFLDYVKSHSDWLFLKKYLFSLAKSAGGFDVCNQLYEDILNDPLIHNVGKQDVAFSKFLKGFYCCLYKIKRLIFGR